MHSSIALILLPTLAAAASAVNFDRRDTSLHVELDMVGNTAVKALITNNGTQDLKVLKTAALLQDVPIEKFHIYQADLKIPFDGIHVLLSTTEMVEDDFQIIASGEVMEKEFDIAHMHDLSAGGAFNIMAQGSVSYAEMNSTKIAGVIQLRSNMISVGIDGVHAQAARTAYLTKRSALQSDCTGYRRAAVEISISNCVYQATKAQAAATAGDKLLYYFKSNSTSVRTTVAEVFRKMALECGSTTNGTSRTYCSDFESVCHSDWLAYVETDYVVYCGSFFKQSPVALDCNTDDQVRVTVHEVTHLRPIKGTSDQQSLKHPNGAYGIEAVRSLTASENLDHADTYALYAQGKRTTGVV